MFCCSFVLMNFLVQSLLGRGDRFNSYLPGKVSLFHFCFSRRSDLCSPREVRINKSTFVFYSFLLLCGDISPNPGPPTVSYPCTICAKSVTDSQRGIECCRCENWTHASCRNVSSDEYDTLSVDSSIDWYCPSCSLVLQESPHTTSNLFSSANSSGLNGSTPVLPNNFPVRSVSCLCFNARSVVNKRLDLLAMLSESSSDIVITETFLDDSIVDSEIIPENYSVFRRDRNRHGGGVLVAISDNLSAVRFRAI